MKRIVPWKCSTCQISWTIISQLIEYALPFCYDHLFCILNRYHLHSYFEKQLIFRQIYLMNYITVQPGPVYEVITSADWASTVQIMVANPASGSAEQRKWIFPASVHASERLVSRVRFDYTVPSQPAHFSRPPNWRTRWLYYEEIHSLLPHYPLRLPI